MLKPSGAEWCALYPTSTSLNDLVLPFSAGAKNFVDALRCAGADVTVTATYRPPERAYLMHWCCMIFGYRDAGGIFHQIAPHEVAPYPGVEIDWTHGGDVGAARAPAVAMRAAFGIVYPAALTSRHTQRLALDMNVRWHGALAVTDARGAKHSIDDAFDGAHSRKLWAVGKTYGVIKLESDPPHWSSDGH